MMSVHYALRIAATFCVLVGWSVGGAARVKAMQILDGRSRNQSPAESMLETDEGPPKEDCTIYNLAELESQMASEEAVGVMNPLSSFYIKDLISDSLKQVCKNKIGANYGRWSVRTASNILVAMQSNYQPRSPSTWKTTLNMRPTQTFRICGFTTLKYTTRDTASKTDSVHVDLLCSHMGYGKILLAQAEFFSKTSLHKRYTDLEAVSGARDFYVNFGYRDCSDPCDNDVCTTTGEELKTKNGYIMKKCLNPEATEANKAIAFPESMGTKKMLDITEVFMSDGKKRKVFESDGKKFRCCCSMVDLCHLVESGRDMLPYLQRTGFNRCGKYIENSHSWSYWDNGRCRVEEDSLTFYDFDAVSRSLDTDALLEPAEASPSS